MAEEYTKAAQLKEPTRLLLVEAKQKIQHERKCNFVSDDTAIYKALEKFLEG